MFVSVCVIGSSLRTYSKRIIRLTISIHHLLSTALEANGSPDM